jgi:hypothetical protein
MPHGDASSVCTWLAFPCRLVTFFVYLNSLPRSAGGRTEFPRLRLAVQPQRGTYVLWYYCTSYSTIDPSGITRQWSSPQSVSCDRGSMRRAVARDLGMARSGTAVLWCNVTAAGDADSRHAPSLQRTDKRSWVRTGYSQRYSRR